MSARYFNWKLAIVLAISLAVLGAGAFSLRQWREANRAERGLRLGNEAYEQHRWEDAAEHLGDYLVIEQTDIPVLLKYADAQLKIRPAKRGNVNQAVGAYRTVLRSDEDHSEAATKLTEIYLGIGSFGEAELIAGRYIAVKPDPELHRMLALAMIRQRKFQEAATQLKAILQTHPEQILAYEVLGQLVEQRPEDFNDKASDLFDKAIDNNPSSALAHVARAGFYRRGKQISAALADLDRAERRDLSNPDDRMRIARELVILGQLERAERHLSIVQGVDAKNQDLWQAWAGLALRSGSKEKMLEVAETGLAELVSQPWDFMPLAAELFVLAGRIEDASDCISELSKKNIARAKVAFLRGLVASERGHLFEAVKHWRQSIESGSKSPRVRLAMASALSDLGDIQSARLELDRVVSENPGYFKGRMALARMLAQAGDWAGTLEHAAAAVELLPENSTAIMLHLRAQTQLLMAGAGDEGRIPDSVRRDIRKQLSELQNKGEPAGEIKLIQLKLALQRKDYAQAKSLIAQLEEAGLSKPKIALAEADSLVAQGNLEQATTKLRGVVEEFPGDFDLVRYLGVLLGRQGDRDSCEQVVQRAMAQIDTPASLRKLGLILAQFYVSWGRKEDAYQSLVGLERKLPDDIPVKRRLLQFEQTMKQSETGQRLVDDIKRLEGDAGWQWRYEQARLWYSAEDFKDRYARVVSILQENIAANPDDQASRVLLARSYERAGALQLAIATYREALNRSPDDIRVIIPAVAALYSAKAYDEAERILNRTSAQNLTHPLLSEWQVQDYLRRGQLDSASGILEDIVSDNPANQNACLSLVLVKMQQKKYGEASTLLNKLKEEYPDSLSVTAAQIQLSFRQGKPEQALRLSDEMVRQINDGYAYMLRARTYATLAQFEMARKDLDHAVSIEPNNAQVWIARSDFSRLMGQTVEAISDIRHALSLASSDISVQKRAVSLFLASREPQIVQEGREILNGALEANPDDTDLKLFEARSFLLDNTLSATESAEAILEGITEESPERSEAWVLLGEIAITQGQSDKAMNSALGGLAHRPKDRTLRLLKARAEAAKSPIVAVPTLEKLHDDNPADVRTALLLANTYTRAGEPKRAMNLLRKQLNTATGANRRLYELAMAVALYKNGAKQRAEKEFRSLLEAEATDPTPLLEHVRLLKEDRLWSDVTRQVLSWYEDHKGDSHVAVGVATGLMAIDDSRAKKEAEQILRSVLRADADCTEAIGALAITYQIGGRTAEAAILYDRLLGLEPDNVLAINNLAWIMSEDQKKYQEALELAQRGLKIAPDYFDLVDTRGVIYFRLGEYDKAVADFSRCIKRGPGEAPAGVATRFYLARALAELGENSRALEQLNEALDLQSSIGGLSEPDLREARLLHQELQEGSRS